MVRIGDITLSQRDIDKIMDDIYKKMPEEKIPWVLDKVPDLLIDLIETGKIETCKTIDLGCGFGNYAIYLAKKGFDVTGVDISPEAIKIARERAEKEKVNCNFIVADVLGNITEKIETKFDFAYDWEFLHHVFPEDRERYIKNVYRLLNQSGKYLSVCFNEEDQAFGSPKKYRKTNIGTILYFSSEDEVKKLFGRYFKILWLKKVKIEGKFGDHIVNYAFMEKR